jgi:hypothetical protein
MAGLDAGGNAGACAQMVDQPKACANEHENDDGGGHVLLHAPTIFLIFEVSHGIVERVLGRLR